MDDSVNSSIFFSFCLLTTLTFLTCVCLYKQSLLSGSCISTPLLSSDNMLMPLYYPFETWNQGKTSEKDPTYSATSTLKAC